MNLKPNTYFIKRFISTAGAIWYGIFRSVSKEKIKYYGKSLIYSKAKRMMENHISGRDHYNYSECPLTSEGFSDVKWYK